MALHGRSEFMASALVLQINQYLYEEQGYPANTSRSHNVGSMLAHRLRRWPNIEPTLRERIVFAG